MYDLDILLSPFDPFSLCKIVYFFGAGSSITMEMSACGIVGSFRAYGQPLVNCIFCVLLLSLDTE